MLPQHRQVIAVLQHVRDCPAILGDSKPHGNNFHAGRWVALFSVQGRRSAFKNYTRLCGVLNCPTFANGRQIWATCPNRCASLQAAQVHVIDCACGAYSEAARSVVSRRVVLRSVILSDHRERRIPVQRGAETQPKDFIKKPRAALRGTVSWDVSLRST